MDRLDKNKTPETILVLKHQTEQLMLMKNRNIRLQYANIDLKREIIKTNFKNAIIKYIGLKSQNAHIVCGARIVNLYNLFILMSMLNYWHSRIIMKND